MKKTIVITDVTRMKEPRVCVFGIDTATKEGIRPTGYNDKEISEEYCVKNNIALFNEMEFNLTRRLYPKPPHTEDWYFDPEIPPRFLRTLSDKEQRQLLENISSESIKSLFGIEIHENRYVNEEEGKRSLGTIRPKSISFVRYSPKEDEKFEYRITFQDQMGDEYDLPVTDLMFRKHCDALKEKVLSHGRIGAQIQETFEKILKDGSIFLRIGLTRPYKKEGDACPKCWLQISSIHTFPRYYNYEL